MLLKLAKTSALVAIAACTLNAADYTAQAEKDRKALIKYFEDKFADPYANAGTFFPYSTEDELKNNIQGDLKWQDFGIGNYAFNKVGQASYEEIKEMPPYEVAIDAGAELYEKKFANGNSFAICFPDPTIGGDYPMFDETRKEVVTLSSAINECLTSNGEKAWGMKKGKMADLEAFIANATKEAEKKVNIKIESAEAEAAYERGKKYYYSQRGYFKMSCATCHVQGAAQRVRNESLSQLLGHTTHFPVYRLKWQGLGTLERRMEGCVKDQGQNPPKPNSKEMKELLYFMAYMSNGMQVDGPDIRK